MAASRVAAFWSYAHEDDELDGGGVLKLAERLRSEFALITGEDLTFLLIELVTAGETSGVDV